MTKAGNGGESLRACFFQSILQTGHRDRQLELFTSLPLGQVPCSWPSPLVPQELVG